MGERPDRPDEVRRDPLDRHDRLDAREPVPAEREIRERAQSGDEVAQSRTEIERTRADMSETVDAIQERLSPENLKEQAKEQAKDTARGAGSTLMETIRENPLPAALTGIGLGWLFMSARRSQGSEQQMAYRGRAYNYPPTYELPPRYGEERAPSGPSAGQGLERAQGRVGDTASQAQERAGQVASRAQGQAQRAQGSFQRMLQENPLAMGALAVGAGAAVGLAVPETQKEHEAMGEARDTLVERAQQKAQDAQQRAQRVAEEAQSAAKEEAQNQGLTEQ